MRNTCPFCEPDPTRVFLRLGHAFALWDGFPVTEGHGLIVPYRHLSSWFDANADERAEIFGAIETVCSVIRNRWGVEHFNVGMNLGAAAGQTVPHLHLHVIPRRPGDVPDPRGGVRHVIPGRGNYLLEVAEVAHELADAASRPVWAAALSSAALRPGNGDAAITTGGEDPLLPRLEGDLARATRVDIAVAFVMRSGIARLYPHLDDLLLRGGALRLVTGDYLDVSDPDALQRLLDLCLVHGTQRCELRIFSERATSFHPKAYLASWSDDNGVAYVGSSNLSESALTKGVEWNYRTSSKRDASGWRAVRAAFDVLFRHPSTQPLDAAWLSGYRMRREAGAAAPRTVVDVAQEAPPEAPAPNRVQEEALAALDETRVAGNHAGLVVMATGLGKTWLAAFDSVQFERVLFVAHREEILHQALATFRRIRPQAMVGLYNGAEREPEAEVLFASIQTLSRQQHLGRFDPGAFDYIVIDEFHHAAASTYRRLIDYFNPQFLLGLTATPERSDGGDLLALCNENLVYRCLVPRGIALGLLCQFDYFGVPDEVDYANIPWRSTRFDEEELTKAVATQARAANVFEQWRARAGERTLAFCVSQRHADFMRDWFRDQGIAAAAVHAGPTSDQRALSLEHLANGLLRVIFAVDMFNEGVDVPTIDTVMMLRPTESPVVWLQQFGRGLRKSGDKRLTVVDYIGNHRSFLLKVRTLLDFHGGSKHELRAALERVVVGDFELPPGCNVTYQLEAVNILRALLPTLPGADTLREYFEDFRERHGMRPSASEAFHDGYAPRAARQAHGSWLGLVDHLGGLGPVQKAAWGDGRAVLDAVETTHMTRSFKMLLLQAMLNADGIPGRGIPVDRLAAEFARLAGRSERLQREVGLPLDDVQALRGMLMRNPIAAWTGPGAAHGETLFRCDDGVFRLVSAVAEDLREPFQQLLRELVDWRLAEYLSKSQDAGQEGLVLKVSHSGGRPILFLPERETSPGLPQGEVAVLIGGERHVATFAKVAVNVVRAADGGENLLPTILRGWFGADAGRPGTSHRVLLREAEEGWVLEPLGQQDVGDPQLHRRYAREQIPPLFGAEFHPSTWNTGFVTVPTGVPKHVCLLVTLHKGDMAQEFQYGDKFLAPDRFQWQSQNRTRQESTHGRLIRDHSAMGVQVHLFVRREKRRAGTAAPFIYCGPLGFIDWEGENPITVRWRLQTAVPERYADELDLPKP